MKKLIVIALFFTYIYADFVDIYRTQGIDAVKQLLEEELKKRSYWDEYLEDKDTQYGYYESINYVLECEKESKELKLHKKIDNKFKMVFEESVFVGQVAGDKQKEGDLKTPTGAYKLKTKITDLDQFYGPMALVTNYPNNFDKAQNKNGHGIWIHGLPYEGKRDDYTQGCIALDNERIKELEKKINFHKSILLISDKKMKPASKEDISLILTTIFNWKDAWKQGDFQRYLSFYDKEFRRYDGLNYQGFKRYKRRIFAKKEKKYIEFSNINIIPYPNALNKRMYKVIMDEDYRTQSYTFVGKKELYLELKNKKVSILTEG